jgi:hypothetical protein
MVWQELNLEDLRCLLAGKQSPKEMLLHVLGLEEFIQLHVINFLWQWWLERNRVWKGDSGALPRYFLLKKVWKGERPRMAESLAEVILKLYVEYPTIGEQEQRLGPRRQRKWSRPPVAVYKINTDGSFSPNSSDGG